MGDDERQALFAETIRRDDGAAGDASLERSDHHPGVRVEDYGFLAAGPGVALKLDRGHDSLQGAGQLRHIRGLAAAVRRDRRPRT